MLRISLRTLGCKVNRADGDALLQRVGHLARMVGFDQEADLYIINSCTVTATADRQSRQLINRARRRNPAARVVLAGCMAATLSPEAIQRLGVDGAFPLDLHPRLIALVEELARAAEPAPAEETARGKDRPVLKIQDGCDCACTYCIVTLARGPGRSLSPQEATAALFDLCGQGFPEVVLTGIHLGTYGHDLTPATSLEALLRTLPEDLPARLRLSSIEPLEVTETLLDMVAGESGPAPQVCPHLHVPVQSGDDEILAAMGRPYGARQVACLLARFSRRVPHLGLGADLMTGFPGEDEEAFRRTVELVESSPLTHLHVFPFSRRPGTEAADLPGQVTRAVARERAGGLREVGRKKLAAFAVSQVGRVHEVVVEGKPRDGMLAGLTGNYLRIRFQGPPELRGKLVRVRALEAAGGELIGVRE